MPRFPDSTSSPTPEQVRQLLANTTKPVVNLLETQGYTVEGWEQGIDEFGATASLTLSNQEARREVDLSLGWVKGNPVVTLMITRRPRESVMDDLFLSRFAQKATAEVEPQPLLLDSKKPVQEEMCRIFGLYAALLRGPAAAIVRGDAWETGHFPDWTL